MFRPFVGSSSGLLWNQLSECCVHFVIPTIVVVVQVVYVESFFIVVVFLLLMVFVMIGVGISYFVRA